MKRVTRPSHSLDSLNKRLQDLQSNATKGEYQAQVRLEAIGQLLDPCLDFSDTDVKRILEKGYSKQVERGLRLYRMMRQIILLCEPIGDTVGVACRVKLINFEELSLSKLLDIKGASNLVLRSAERKDKERFNGLELLSSEEKVLYQRLKPYFGGKKKPTLKSLAIGLLGEEDEIFTDRSALNHIAAVREFKTKHKDDLGYRWFFMGTIDFYNRDTRTGREIATEALRSMREAAMKSMLPHVAVDYAQIARGLSPQISSSLQGAALMFKSLPQFSANSRYMAEAVGSLIKAISQNTMAGLVPLPSKVFGLSFK